MRRAVVLFFILLMLCFAGLDQLAAQELPGLTPWDGRTAVQALRRSPWVIRRTEGEAGETIWIKQVHLLQKPTGFYFLTINGQEMDWRELYVTWGGRIVNLALLFQYGRQVNEAGGQIAPWIDVPPWPEDRPQ